MVEYSQHEESFGSFLWHLRLVQNAYEQYNIFSQQESVQQLPFCWVSTFVCVMFDRNEWILRDRDSSKKYRLNKEKFYIIYNFWSEFVEWKASNRNCKVWVSMCCNVLQIILYKKRELLSLDLDECSDRISNLFFNDEKFFVFDSKNFKCFDLWWIITQYFTCFLCFFFI